MASEAELRAALAGAPQDTRIAAALAELLAATERADEARTLLAPYVAKPEADIFVLTADANLLKALGRLSEAIAVYQRARDATPASAVAEHNLAGALGDAQRFAEAEAAASRAFAKGLDAPETWLVQARALQGLGRFDEAESAYREALRRRPGFAAPLADLAQLIWMRTGDGAAAVADLDAAIRLQPASLALRLQKATLLEYAGDAGAAYAALLATPPALRGDWTWQVRAAQLASDLDPAAALTHAEQAAAQQTDQLVARVTLCQAQLAAGRLVEAGQTAEALHARWPDDQHAIALIATVWRALGDPRYRVLYDYDGLVAAQAIETPPGWPSLAAYLDDLAAALGHRHVYAAHPFGQSVRGGSQTEQSLALSDDPAIRAFFTAVDGPIRRYIAGLGRGDDPLRRRIADGYRFEAIWSVRLAPRGFHADHVHQQGWISSACYIALPDAVANDHEGWLKLGEPGVTTLPPLGPEHFVQPQPGRLVLFPSYMWHGTVPFGGEQPRLSIAFDLLPA